MISPPHSAVPRPGATAVLSCTWALGISGTTMMPLIVANLMARLGLDEGHATLLGGMEMIGMLAGCIMWPRLARRRPRRLTGVALALLVLSQLLSGWPMPAPLLGALRLLAGVCEALMIVMVGRCLACHADAERLWAVVILLSGLAVAGVFTALSLLPALAAGGMMWLGLGLFALLLGGVALRVATLVPEAAAPLPALRRDRGGVWLAWAMFVGVYSVQAGVWTVSVWQGSRIGLTLPSIGMLLSVSSLLGFFGALVPALAVLAQRRAGTVAAAIVVMFLAVLGFFNARGAGTYFAAQLLLNLAFYAIMAVMNSFISQRDRDGSVLSQTVVVTFAAVALGTVGAGALFQWAGGLGVIGFALLALAASVPPGLAALRGAGASAAEPVAALADGPAS